MYSYLVSSGRSEESALKALASVDKNCDRCCLKFSRRQRSNLIKVFSSRRYLNCLRELRKLGFTARDARSEGNESLRMAAENGHVVILRELRENWGLTAEDARANNNVALQMAAVNGHVAILQELRENWGLTAEDARTENNGVLLSAARNGHVAVLRELRKGWGLTAEDARTENNVALAWAVGYSHAAILRELREGWGLSAQDARTVDVAHWMTENCNPAVLRELRENWGFTIEDAHSLLKEFSNGTVNGIALPPAVATEAVTTEPIASAVAASPTPRAAETGGGIRGLLGTIMNYPYVWMFGA